MAPWHRALDSAWQRFYAKIWRVAPRRYHHCSASLPPRRQHRALRLLGRRGGSAGALKLLENQEGIRA